MEVNSLLQMEDKEQYDTTLDAKLFQRLETSLKKAEDVCRQQEIRLSSQETEIKALLEKQGQLSQKLEDSQRVLQERNSSIAKLKAKLQAISDSKNQELEELRTELKRSQEQAKVKAENEQRQAVCQEYRNNETIKQTIGNVISRLEAEIGKLERLPQANQIQPAQPKSGLPIHWKKMEVNDMVKVRLDVTDSIEGQEYSEVEKHFQSTLPHVTIVTITRFQNAQIWESYNLKKLQMERKYGQGAANELHLYHGTRHDVIENIIHENFDFRLAGTRVGALYGDGCTFATTSKYCDLYCSTDFNGHKFMLVAKVLAGKVCMGQAGLKRPPLIDQDDFKKGYYDAVVNNAYAPTIYVVFDNNQYYPEYCIEYY